MSCDVALKERLDVSKIFLSFAATGGDVVATAQLADCEIRDVVSLSIGENWMEKLSSIGLQQGINSDDAKRKARERNRMACYIQAVRLRALIDKTLQQIFENEENLDRFCSERDKKGDRFMSMKPVREMVDAAESVHNMLYRALGDTIDKKGDGSDDVPLGKLKSLHFQVIQHLNMAGGTVPEQVTLAEKNNHTDLPQKAMGYLDVADIMDAPEQIIAAPSPEQPAEAEETAVTVTPEPQPEAPHSPQPAGLALWAARRNAAKTQRNPGA